jgi:hypothetical protein
VANVFHNAIGTLGAVLPSSTTNGRLPDVTSLGRALGKLTDRQRFTRSLPAPLEDLTTDIDGGNYRLDRSTSRDTTDRPKGMAVIRSARPVPSG